MNTKKFTAVVEVRLTDEKLAELVKWEVTPTSYIDSVISDHLSERGLLNNVTTWELGNISNGDVMITAYTTLNKVAESLEHTLALDSIEQDILTKSCPNGVCDD